MRNLLARLRAALTPQALCLLLLALLLLVRRQQAATDHIQARLVLTVFRDLIFIGTLLSSLNQLHPRPNCEILYCGLAHLSISFSGSGSQITFISRYRAPGAIPAQCSEIGS